jgi:formyl-CoA transferase
MDEIDRLVEGWTRARRTADAVAALTRAHVPCAPVRTAREIVDDPHLRARGLWVDVDHPRRGRVRVPTSPIRLHGSAAATVDRPAPLLGQDTDRVLTELLGLAPETLQALRAAGVTGPR